MNMPLYVIYFVRPATMELMEEYFYTTKDARDFLWNNRNKIIDSSIYLFGSMTEITEKDLRD